MEIQAEIINEVNAPKNDHEKLFICLGGSSESGKSSFSLRMMQIHGANRVKYLKAAHEFGMSSNAGDTDPFSMLGNPNEEERSENEIGTWRTIDRITDYNDRITVIESLKHPSFLRSFAKTALNACLYVVYIDADYSLRVEREAVQLGVSVADIEPKIRLKDAEKVSYGSEQVRQIADIVLRNNGSEVEYHEWIDDFATKLRVLYPGSNQLTNIEYL
jgi:hypothetical protein